MRQPQTPSFTKSPSTCGGKCLVGFLSHSRICSLRSFARARIARVDIIYTIRNLPNYNNTDMRASKWPNASLAQHPTAELISQLSDDLESHHSFRQRRHISADINTNLAVFALNANMQYARAAHLSALLAHKASPRSAGCQTIPHHERSQWPRGASRCWIFRFSVEGNKNPRVSPFWRVT